MTDIYTDNGYTDRAEYLDSLAEEYGMDINMVLNLAELLGPNEDFDGLVTTIQDYSARLSRSSADDLKAWQLDQAETVEQLKDWIREYLP
jgi:hypothetical protein